MAGAAGFQAPTDISKQATQPTQRESPAPPRRLSHHHNDRAIPLVVMLGLALTAIAGAELILPNAGSNPGALRSGVNPNTAQWWELVALPEIGPTLANEITRYRDAVGSKNGDAEHGSVFRSAADLAKVRGIGPKTVARLAPHLRFDKTRHDPVAFEDQRSVTP